MAGESGNPGGLSRRRLLQRGSVLALLASGVPLASRVASADGARSVEPYGRLLKADANGLRLAPGFSSRVVARSGDRVGVSGYVWHEQPDGGACFDVPGGFVYVSNSELEAERGGAGAIRFDERGSVIDAYRVLDGTNRNCSGGTTPWGTWLSCEESGPQGRVFECDPLGARAARLLPRLGRFNHEAVEVVPSARSLFLTEDHPEGRFYRFLPTSWPDLDSGRLQAAAVDDGRVTWVDVSDREPDRSDDTTAFDGGEGLASWGDDVFLATKGDKRIWRYDVRSSTIDVAHDCVAAPNTVLDSVDSLSVDPATGDLFVAEDGPTQDLAIVVANEIRGPGDLRSRSFRGARRIGSHRRGPESGSFDASRLLATWGSMVVASRTRSPAPSATRTAMRPRRRRPTRRSIRSTVLDSDRRDASVPPAIRDGSLASRFAKRFADSPGARRRTSMRVPRHGVPSTPSMPGVAPPVLNELREDRVVQRTSVPSGAVDHPTSKDDS